MRGRKTTDEEVVGKKYGRLTIKGFTDSFTKTRRGSSVRRVLCICDCGNEKEMFYGLVKTGDVKSCGCLRSEITRNRLTSHGMRRTRVYQTWMSMMSRHTGSTSPDRYRDKGIRVCKRWHRFENFLRDMGERPDKTSIDRVDNMKGYYPSNCRWATQTQQVRNRGNTIRVKYGNKNWAVQDLAEHLGLKASVIIQRLRRGWTLREAIEIPKGGKRKA